MPVAIIAGLGNPGQSYRNTRHNIGFDVVDRLASRLGGVWRAAPCSEAETALVAAGGASLILVKPQTFMNNSGRSLGAMLHTRGLGPEKLLVIYDDMNIDVGRVKLSINGSAGGHRGIADLLDRIGPGFARYRIGIGAKLDKEMDLADYVLSRFTPEERELLADRMPAYLEHLLLILDQGIDQASNTINRRMTTTHDHNDKQPV